MLGIKFSKVFPLLAPPEETAKDKGLAGEVSASTKKKGRTVAITAEDIQKRKNDVKARTTLLLALPDEHQLRFSKYDTAKELWEAIVSHLEFIDVPIEQDDLNQKFLTSLAPEWLVYIIVWRNKDDLDIMSLDYVYNHLKVYELEVQKRAGSNSQNMAFISLSNTSSVKSEVPTVQGVSTASAQVSTDSTDVAAASLSYDTTSKKITIQGPDVAGFDKSKVKCFNCHKMGHFSRECRSPRSYDRGKKESYKKDPKVEQPAPKAMIAIDGIGVIWMRKMKLQIIMLLWPMKKKPTPSIDVSKSVSKELEERWKSNNPSFFEQGGSSGNVVSKSMIKFVKESGCPNATKVNNTKNARKPTVKYAKMYKNTSQSPRVMGNQRNWNNKKSQQLGKDFMVQNKVRYNYGSFDHLEFNCKHDIWVDKGKTWTRVNHDQDNMKYTSTHKHSNVKRPFERKSAAKNKVWVPTVRSKIPTVGTKVLAAKPTVATDKGNKGKAVKASAHWIWKPKQNSSCQGLNFNGVLVTFKKYQYIDI
nr:ribonuclease H-like domain-containing protein [Tanacetum cinerariifolium]